MSPKQGVAVYDRWWPWRIGRVARVLRSGVVVQWSDGERQTYDSAHCKFLVEEQL